MIISSPLKGKLIPITEVPDETFAKKFLGDGFAIDPVEGKLFSPVAGTIAQFFRTGHALGIESEGLEVLIHVGIDTVKLKGEGFRPKVETGQKVKVGDLLLEFDPAVIKNSGKSLITCVVFTNMDKVKKFEINTTTPNVNVGDKIATLELN